MQDLTEGPIPGHLARMAIPIAIGMVFQTLYYLVDLYFVAQLGEAAIAGLASAGTLQFLIMSLTQILGVGTMALIAHASGRKDRSGSWPWAIPASATVGRRRTRRPPIGSARSPRC